MADKHPYISGVGNISQTLNHFRKTFPNIVDSATLKKLGLAPNNESFLLNILKFIKLLSETGEKTKEAGDVFSQHKDDEFRKKFEPLIKSSYNGLFELYGDKTWEIDLDSLITFFRSTDQTSALIGKHQARTFKVLAAICGYGELPPEKPVTKTNVSSKKKIAKKSGKKKKTTKIEPPLETPPIDIENQTSKVSLTVRVEVNLPADGDQKTYDRIFKSIRENLINGR
jgi:hypothetical protein